VSGSWSLFDYDLNGYLGGTRSQNILINDAVFGNGGNDTVTFTDSDYLWWSGHQEGAALEMHGYIIASDISNLVLQMGAPTARNGTGNRTSTGNGNGEGSNLIVGNEFDNILDGNGVGGQNETGTGIDTLTGDGGQTNIQGSDNFIIGSRYRDSTSNVWNPEIVKTDISTVDPITGAKTALFQYDWDKNASEYKDFDYVIITDFDANDNLELAGTAAEYSIGNLPSVLTAPGGDVGAKGTDLSAGAFGIYYTGAGLYGTTNPNLVAVIQTADLTLRGNLTARPTVPSPQTSPSGVTPAAPFGWDDGNDFYLLAGTNFANNVNQIYNQQASTASLSDLMGQIV
jgi:hypothetical protein